MLISAVARQYLSLFKLFAWFWVSLRCIIQNQNPIQRLAIVGWGKGQDILVFNLANFLAFACAWRVSPDGEFFSFQHGAINRKFPAYWGIDHCVAAFAIYRRHETVATRSRNRGVDFVCDNKFRCSDATEIWTREHQVFQMLQLCRCGSVECLAPGHKWSIDGVTTLYRRVIEAPQRVVSVCCSARAAKYRPIDSPALIPRYGVSLVVGAELQRMVVVERLYVYDWFCGSASEIINGIYCGAEVLRVPCLSGIEIKPLVIVKPLRGATSARRVEGYKVILIHTPYASCHSTNNLLFMMLILHDNQHPEGRVPLGSSL